MPTLGKITNCAYCNKGFIYGEGRTKASKFCSDVCYQLHTDSRICKFCRKTFIRERLKSGQLSKSVYCSKECELNYYNSLRKQEHKFKSCIQCGKIFELHRVNNNKCWSKQDFCSDTCFKQHYLDNNVFKSICKCCGKEFVRQRINGRLSRSVYCSNECAIRGQAEAYNKTCLEKYGISYNCLLPRCQLAPKNNHQVVSKINIHFAEILSKYNIDFEIEFNNNGKIISYFYDFYLPEYNLIIEINPTFSHSVRSNQLGWCVPNREYHYNKVKIANQNGYQCICIWDWDNKEAIVKAIKNNTLKIEKCSIRKIWSVCETVEYKFDNNFDESQMLSKGYLPIYDDGQQLIY